MIDASRLWLAEWIAAGFFVYLVVLAGFLEMAGHRRRRIVMVGLACVTLIVVMSQLPPWPALRIAREWLPSIYLLQGYWLCGLFFRRPMLSFERRLLGIDQMVLDVSGIAALSRRGPRWVLEYFELAYLTVYPYIPATFGLFLWLGDRQASDRFWTTVLVAGLGAYGMLPLIQTRPPRTIEPSHPLDDRDVAVRRLNLQVLDRASVQVNTFPSGHASTAMAAALAVATVDLGWGLGLLALATSITLATVVGRYHFVVDSVLGVALGLVGWWIGFGDVVV